jgi:hypothetical protein
MTWPIMRLRPALAAGPRADVVAATAVLTAAFQRYERVRFGEQIEHARLHHITVSCEQDRIDSLAPPKLDRRPTSLHCAGRILIGAPKKYRLLIGSPWTPRNLIGAPKQPRTLIGSPRIGRRRNLNDAPVAEI